VEEDEELGLDKGWEIFYKLRTILLSQLEKAMEKV
jgi:hypothetical protein